MLKRGAEMDDQWLIDNISMQTAKEALSKFAQFRWRVRMMLPLSRWKIDINTSLRVDYFTGYVVLLMGFFLSVAILVFETKT